MVNVENSLNRIWLANATAYDRTGAWRLGQDLKAELEAFDQVNYLDVRASEPVDNRLQGYVGEVAQTAEASMHAKDFQTARANVRRVFNTIRQARDLATQLKAQLKKTS